MFRRTHCRFNLTSLTNEFARAQELRKWSKLHQEGGPSLGIPRRPRLEMRSISVIHETKRVIVAGRNRCNGFACNQFMIADKKTLRACMIDLSDDWPDDWVAFIREGEFKVVCVFLTHCHLDNILGLAPFLNMVPGTPVAWNIAEEYWVNKIPEACDRYQRPELKYCRLPMHTPYDTTNNILLSCGSSRSQSFIELGECLLMHIHTPGHSLGHMALSVPSEKLLFTGDLIFYDTIGRVDLPNATGSDLAQSLRLLEDFPDNTVLLPGHGRLTTLARERRSNAGLQRVYEQIALGKHVPSVGLNGTRFL